MAAVAEAAEAAEASEAAQTAEAATIAEAAQTAHTAEAAIAEAAEAAESSKAAADTAEAAEATAMSDAMSDSCHGDGFRVVPVVGNVVAGAGHGDQTEQKKHSSDLHVDLRRTKAAWMGNSRAKLQALVYDILPSTTAVFSYAIGSRNLSANEQFFVGAQTVVSLLQTTQIKQGVLFIAANKVYTSRNKTTIV